MFCVCTETTEANTMAEQLRGPMCSTRCGRGWIDDGTMCLNRSYLPGATGRQKSVTPNKHQAIDANRYSRSKEGSILASMLASMVPPGFRYHALRRPMFGAPFAQTPLQAMQNLAQRTAWRGSWAMENFSFWVIEITGIVGGGFGEAASLAKTIGLVRIFKSARVFSAARRSTSKSLIGSAENAWGLRNVKSSKGTTTVKGARRQRIIAKGNPRFQGCSKRGDCLQSVEVLLDSIYNKGVTMDTRKMAVFANRGSIRKAIDYLADRLKETLRFGRKYTDAIPKDGDYVVFLNEVQGKLALRDVGDHVLFARRNGGTLYFYDPQTARRVIVERNFTAFEILWKN